MAHDVFDNEDPRYRAEARRWPYVLNYRTEGSHEEEGMIHNPSTCVHIYPQSPTSDPSWGWTTSSPKYAFDDWVEAAAHCLDRTGHPMLICKTCSPARRDVRQR
jgi:hypothetical protein